MDSLDRITLAGCASRRITACLAGAAFLLLAAGTAQARTETLRWTHEEASTVSAFRIYTRTPGGSFGAPVYDGKPGPNAGVYSRSISVPDDAIIVVAVSAVGEADLEGPLSNASTRMPDSDDPLDDDFDDEIPEPDPNGALYRLNAGGPAYVDGSGRTWSPDAAYVGAGNMDFSNGNPAIAGTGDDGLYQTHRFQFDEAAPMRYQLPVPNGEVLVKLHFAEVYDGASSVGVRVFDLSVENDLVVNDLDIYREAGADRLHVESILADVSDGSLTLDLAYADAWPPMLMALEVFAIEEGGGGARGSKVDGTASLSGMERMKIADSGKIVGDSDFTISIGDGVFMALDGGGNNLMGTVTLRGDTGRDARKADLALDAGSMAIIRGVIEQRAAALGDVVTVLPDPEVRLKVNRSRNQMKLLGTFRVTSGDSIGRYKLELKGPFSSN